MISVAACAGDDNAKTASIASCNNLMTSFT
jgi:hypothetical protein